MEYVKNVLQQGRSRKLHNLERIKIYVIYTVTLHVKMYRPCALFIDTDRPISDKLITDLNTHIMKQKKAIGGRIKSLRRHPTNPFCVYTPWYMVDVAADSKSDWEMDDHGTGIFPILEKYGFQFGGASALYNVGNKEKMTTLMISFDHEGGPSDNWMNVKIDTSVAQKEYDKMMDKFKKQEDQWNKRYPDPNKSDSDKSMMDEDSDEDSNDSSNDGSYSNYGRGVTMDEKAKARLILGITIRDPTKAEIRRAYMEKARKVHPDKGGSNEAMKRINNAKDILLPFKPVLKF